MMLRPTEKFHFQSWQMDNVAYRGANYPTDRPADMVNWIIVKNAKNHGPNLSDDKIGK